MAIYPQARTANRCPFWQRFRIASAISPCAGPSRGMIRSKTGGRRGGREWRCRRWARLRAAIPAPHLPPPPPPALDAGASEALDAVAPSAGAPLRLAPADHARLGRPLADPGKPIAAYRDRRDRVVALARAEPAALAAPTGPDSEDDDLPAAIP